MAIKVSQAFERTSAAPIDVTIALTKAQMLTVNDNLMPKYYFTICQDDGKIYLYDKTATASGTTGKFKEFSGGGGGDVKIFTTTATLDKDINDTTVVAAADLPGITWTDLKAGASIVKDAKGTLGVVTLITGTTSVTVTTATTSTPTKELTQAQYDALVAAGTVDPDVIYLVTDQDAPAVYMGAYDTVYSNTERVVGSYMGKPLYQKTFIKDNISIAANADTKVVLGSGATNAEIVTAFGSNNRATTVPYAWPSITITGEKEGDDFCAYVNRAGAATTANLSITFQYTKTTDTTSPVEYASPNDYSTSEKIVGTWVDGKPIYQKTITGTANVGSGSYQTIGNISTLLPNLDTVVENSISGFCHTPDGYDWYSNNNFAARIDSYQQVAVTQTISGTAYPFTYNLTIKYTKVSS